MINSLVSIVIVNWNGKKHLSYSLSFLEKINYPSFEVIVVDNGSTDGSVEMVKEKFPKVFLIESRTNLGFAKANNIGFKKAKGEYILLLNSDTKVTPDFLKKLVDVMNENKKIGVVQPKIVFMDSKKLQAGGAFLTNTGFLYHFGYGKNPDEKKYNQQMEIFSANGSCMLVKREVIEKVGLFDPDFFCYFEETDFCWRVWLAGYKILYVPRVMIYHKGGQAAQRLKFSFVNFNSFKNRICSLIKNLGFLEILKILPIHLLICEIYALLMLVKLRFGLFVSIQKAILWNVKELPHTLAKRRYIQNKIRIINDKKYFSFINGKVRLNYYLYLFSGLKDYED